MRVHKNWCVVSLISAAATAAVVAITFLLPSNYALGLLAVAVATFLMVLLHNPSLRYWRLTVTVVTAWLAAHMFPTLLARLRWRNDLLAEVWLNQDVGWGFDTAVALIVLTLLLLDFRLREGGSGTRQFLSLFRIGSTRQASRGGAAQQNNVGDVTGNNNTITFAQHNGLGADEVGRLLQARPFDGNAEIDLAVGQTTGGKPDTAIHLLTAMRKRDWHRLDERQRYRLVANLGHAYERKGEYTEAGKCYLECKGYQPDDTDARAHEACGYYALGEPKRAYDLAVAVLKDHPLCALATVARLRSAPADAPFAELEESVPLSLRDEPDVAFALSLRAMGAGELEAAERLARLALRKGADVPQFKDWLGGAIIQREGHADIRGHRPPDRGRVEEAVRLLSEALNGTQAKKECARIRYTRAEGYGLLGRMEEAETDFRATLEDDAANPDVARRFAILLDERGRRDAAIDLLRATLAPDVTASNRVVLASLLAERDKGNDRAEAVDVLRAGIAQAASEEIHYRAALVSTAVRMLGLLGRHGEATQLLDELPAGYLTEPVGHVARAEAHRRAGRSAEALEEGRLALQTLGEKPPMEEQLRVAESLTALGEHQAAFGVWRTVVHPEVSLDLIRPALESARQAGEDQFILTFCEQLRAAGRFDPYCLELEVFKREEYCSYDVAIGVMQEYLRHPSNDDLARVFRVRLSLLGRRLGRSELIEPDPAKLPPVETVQPLLGGAVASILSMGPNPLEGVRYAYELVRRHFHLPEVFEAYLAIVGIGDDEVDLPEPTVVGPGCAFRYRAEDNKEEKWVIVENSPGPSLDRQEVGPDHYLARQAHGLAVGGTFHLRKDGIQDRLATVTGLLSKYAYRKLYVMENLEDRFPGRSSIRRYTMPTKEDGTPDLTSIFRALDQAEEQNRRLNELYRDNPLSLTTYAQFSRLGLLHSLTKLAGDSSLVIRCCAGTAEERQEAESTLQTASALVIEPSALATLFLIGHYEKLAQVPVPCIVVESSLDEYRELHQRLLSPSQGFDGKLNGKFLYRHDDPAARGREQQRVATFLERIRLLAVIVTGEALAAVPPDQRKTLIDLHGRPTAEAIATSLTPGRVLWTDDFVVGLMTTERMQGRRAWTQLVAQWLAFNGHLGFPDVVELTLWLVNCHYHFTQVDPATVIAACKEADWDPKAAPLAAVIAWFGSPDLRWEGLLQVSAHSLRFIWDEAILAHRRDGVARALVRAILTRKDGRQLASALRDGLDALFGLNAVAIEEFRDMITQELAGRTASGLIVPKPRKLWQPIDQDR
jgi:tetratricopeptide (TPR) repeat protein